MSERDVAATTVHVRVTTIFAGDGPCTLCSCPGYSADPTDPIGGHCKCGDRHGDHRDADPGTGDGDGSSARKELVLMG
jgi:hypothetical protein